MTKDNDQIIQRIKGVPAVPDDGKQGGDPNTPRPGGTVMPEPENDLLEAVTQAIVDCHPRLHHHASYADWKQYEDDPDHPQHELAVEWLTARRAEARAAILIVLNR